MKIDRTVKVLLSAIAMLLVLNAVQLPSMVYSAPVTDKYLCVEYGKALTTAGGTGKDEAKDITTILNYYSAQGWNYVDFKQIPRYDGMMGYYIVFSH